MKLLIILIAILLLIWAIRANAATPKIYGVNYGHNFAGKRYDPVLASKDLNELKAAGVQSVRIYVGTPGNPEVDMTKQLALLAKSKGFSVIWGVSSDGQGFNSVDDILPYAQWADENHIDYFTVGNEEPDNAVVNSLAVIINFHYPNLKLTTAVAAYQENINYWSSGFRALDTVGFNVYVDFGNLTYQIKQNPRGYISEWNTDGGLDAVGGSQSRWARELVKDRNIINNSGLKAYLFVIRGNGGGINNDWSMWVGSTRRLAWQQLLK